MKSKIKTKLLALALSPWMLASVSAIPDYNYGLSLNLQDAEKFEFAFVDSLGLGNWTGVDGRPEMPAGSSFSINVSTGLELTSSSPEPTVAGQVWKYLLPLDSDWEVEVQAHIANFTPTFMASPKNPDPVYYTGPTLVFVGNGTIDPVQAFSNRLNWIFVRSLGANRTLENTLQEGAYLAGNGSTDPVVETSSEDVVLTLRYTSSNRSLTTLWRPLNGTDSEVTIYPVDQWTTDGNPPAFAALALTAASKPLSDEAQFDLGQDYSLEPGLVYLKNLNIAADLSDDMVLLSSRMSTGSVSAPPSGGSPAVEKSKKKGKSSAKKSSGSKKKSEAKKAGGKKKSEGKKSGGKKKKKR